MASIVQLNSNGTYSPNNSLREFAELLKYELKIDNISTETVMDSIKYMEHRGFKVYKDR